MSQKQNGSKNYFNQKKTPTLLLVFFLFFC